jgi:hypothetical protein
LWLNQPIVDVSDDVAYCAYIMDVVREKMCEQLYMVGGGVSYVMRTHS